MSRFWHGAIARHRRNECDANVTPPSRSWPGQWRPEGATPARPAAAARRRRSAPGARGGPRRAPSAGTRPRGRARSGGPCPRLGTCASSPLTGTSAIRLGVGVRMCPCCAKRPCATSDKWPKIRSRGAAHVETAASTASSTRSAPKRTTSSAGRPVALSASATAARAASSSSVLVLSATAATRAGRTGACDRLVGGHELGERLERQVRVVAQGRGAGLVDQHQHVRGRPVEQPERHAGVGGVEERALALDEEQVAALRALVHEPLGGPGHVVGDHVVHGQPPAGDRNPGLPGGHVHRRAARARAPRGPARASPPSCRSPCPSPRCAPPAPRPCGWPGPAGTVRSGGAARRSRRPVPRRSAAARSSGSAASSVWRPASRSSPASIASSRAGRHAGSSLPPVGATPISSVVAPRSIASATLGHHRHVAQAERLDLGGRAAGVGGVHDRHHLAVAVPDHAVGGLAAVARRRGPPRRSRAARSSPAPPRARGHRRAARARRASSSPSNGCSASSRWPSRSTQSASEPICAAGATASCDSTMQPIITPSPSARAAWIIRTASRTPPDFASLTFTASA